jgi:hypothetical protein
VPIDNTPVSGILVMKVLHLFFIFIVLNTSLVNRRIKYNCCHLKRLWVVDCLLIRLFSPPFMLSLQLSTLQIY